MFIMALMLGFTSFVIEMMIASSFPYWRQLAHKNKAFNMIASIGLSSTIGFLFGAQGLIMMTGALFGTMLSIPGYAFLHWNYDTPKAKSSGGNRYDHMKKQAKPKYEKAKELGGDLAKTGWFVGRTITAPIWISRKIYRKVKK